MKILITGADGYIGRLVEREIVEQGKFKFVDFIDLNRNGNIETFENLDHDVLVHLAAYISVPESFNHAHVYYENNCYRYHKFLNLNNNKFKHVIYASSNAIFDDNGNINPESVYGSTKLEGEYITKRYTANHAIFRFANPVGIDPELHKDLASRIASGYPNVMWALADAKVKGSKFQIHNLPGMIRDFYPATWIAKVIAHAAINATTGTYNLGSGKDTEVMPLLIDICEKNGIDYELINPPEGTSKGFRSNPAMYAYVKQVLKNRFYEFDPVEYCKFALTRYVNTLKELKND